MQQTRRRRRVQLSPWLWVGSRRERGSRDLVPDRRLLPEHASIDEDYWRTDVDVPIVFSERPALFKVISRVEEPRTTCFDNTYLPVLLEAFFNGSLMNDQLVDPVSLLIMVLHKPRRRYFALTLSWNFHCWINVTLLSWYFYCWINNAFKSWILGLVADLCLKTVFVNSLLGRLSLFVRSKENISRVRVEGAKMSYGPRLVYRSCVGRPRTAHCFAKCRTILTHSISLGWVCFVCVRACVSGRGRSWYSRHTQ